MLVGLAGRRFAVRHVASTGPTQVGIPSRSTGLGSTRLALTTSSEGSLNERTLDESSCAD